MPRANYNFDARYSPVGRPAIQPSAWVPVEKTCKCGEKYMAKGWNSKRCGQCQAKAAKNCFPDRIESMRVEGDYLIVDTTVKRYRVYERPGRKARRRLVGFLKDLA